MTDSRNDITNEQAVLPMDPQENNVCEDEINLIDYFLVLWKYKWFVLLGSILPTLIVGLVLFFMPNRYEITYVYDVQGNVRGDVRDGVRDGISGWDLNEKNFSVFVSSFYSEENSNKIINKLRKNRLNEYGELLSNSNGLLELLKFEPVPSYIDLSKVEITDPEQLEQFRKLTAQLLNVTIIGRSKIGRPKERLIKMASVVRENIEEVMPMYSIQREVINTINEYRAKMGDIEKSRFDIELDLKRNKAVLAKLKEIEVGVLDKTEDNVTLQFDVGSNSEYLPLKYQVQAAESQLIYLEKQIVMNEANYEYYKNLLALNEKLAEELTSNISSYYTIQQFHSYLTELVASYETKELKDYLASYIKGIENRISVSVPVLENPKIYSIAKGTAKKSGIVFVIALMISVFVAFLGEGLKKIQAQVS